MPRAAPAASARHYSREEVRYWLIRYDRLPPGYRSPPRRFSWIGAMICLLLYGFGFYHLLTA